MVINFGQTLDNAFKDIGCSPLESVIYSFHKEEAPAGEKPQSYRDELGSKLVESIRRTIPAYLNNRFSGRLKEPFKGDSSDPADEPAYFLFETFHNASIYSQYNFTYQISLWIGNSGFILGVEQKGTGFDAVNVNEKRIKTHMGGTAFEFFRNCKSEIFFNNPHNANIVYMKYIVPK